MDDSIKSVKFSFVLFNLMLPMVTDAVPYRNLCQKSRI